MYEKELHIAVSAVRDAGSVIKQGFGKVNNAAEKESYQELVTQIDREADRRICRSIERFFPGHNILSEESSHSKKDSEFSWFVDPLDGTTNFISHVPFFCSAVGLLRRQVPVAGAIYDPILDELFCASLGGGAFLNNEKIRHSENPHIKKTLINFCHKNTKDEIERISREWVSLKLLGRDLRRLGSGNLDIAYVASGRNDAYFSSSKIFDIAPALIIAKEAGCKISNWAGKEWSRESNGIAITNGLVHSDLISILSKMN
jgi:myo-inositol-1(or 4)-monophosphatase